MVRRVNKTEGGESEAVGWAESLVSVFFVFILIPLTIIEVTNITISTEKKVCEKFLGSYWYRVFYKTT